MEPRFGRALADLQQLFLESARDLQIPIHFALIGGLAMSAWGVIRATADIDLLAHSIPSPLRDPGLRHRMKSFLESRGSVVDWRVGDSDDPIPLLLRIRLTPPAPGIDADILWAHKQWQREALARTVTLKVSGMDVFVLHPEDLILLKLEAGGPQDLLDVESLLAESPPQLDIVGLKRKARRLRLSTTLAKLLRPRRR
jgi:hypothetical protein